MNLSPIRLARIQRAMDETLTAIAEDVKAGEFDSKAIAAELNEVADIIESLEKAGYEVEISEEMMDRMGAKKCDKDEDKKDEDKKDEKKSFDQDAAKKAREARIAAIRERIAAKRQADKKAATEKKPSIRERIAARLAEKHAARKESKTSERIRKLQALVTE